MLCVVVKRRPSRNATRPRVRSPGDGAAKVGGLSGVQVRSSASQVSLGDDLLMLIWIVGRAKLQFNCPWCARGLTGTGVDRPWPQTLGALGECWQRIRLFLVVSTGVAVGRGLHLLTARSELRLRADDLQIERARAKISCSRRSAEFARVSAGTTWLAKRRKISPGRDRKSACSTVSG